VVKKLTKKILSLILINLALLLILKSPVTATGYNLDLGKDITIGKDENLKGPYLNYGNNATVSGTVDGDIYIGGGFVTIDGTINGDLFVGGGVVTVKGTVSDDVRVVGGMINIDGRVGKNVTALGGTVAVGSDGTIGQSLLAFGGNVIVLGNINQGATIYGDEVVLAGRVGEQTQVTATKISAEKTAILDGGLNYTSEKDAEIADGAAITGAVNKNLPPQVVPTPQPVLSGLGRLALKFQFLSFLSLLLIGLLLVRFVPRQTSAVAKLIGERPWRSLGIGFLTVILAPIAMLLLAVTIIGLPLAILLGLAYAIAICLSSIFSGLFVGQKVFDWLNLKENPYLMLGVGMLILQLIFAVPIVGTFAQILSVLAAVGAMLMLKREALRKLEAKK
jgi:hypothetical protein